MQQLRGQACKWRRSLSQTPPGASRVGQEILRFQILDRQQSEASHGSQTEGKDRAGCICQL